MKPVITAVFGASMLFGLAACQTVDGRSADARQEAPHPTLAFAQGACGGCHAVERFGLSPNTNSPPFAVIANTRDLTAETLTAWLRDAHNYPEDMDFDLDPPQVEALVDYILSLKDPNYRPIVG